MITQQFNQQQLIAMLSWQFDMGADEALFDTPSNETTLLPLANIIPGLHLLPAKNAPSPVVAKMAVPNSAELSLGPSSSSPELKPQASLGHLSSLQDLFAALDQFDSCSLKHTASETCFADGNAGSRLMIIGEAPGRDEDRLGLPFVGATGQFLDSMMASIGLDRSSVYLTNFLPWRPPGNRSPTVEEIAMLLPFLYRHVQLAKPEFILVLGGVPAKIILNSDDNILKLRGRWHDIDYGDGVFRPTMASLHPTYLMRSPAQKRLAFDDWLYMHRRLVPVVSANICKG